MRKYQNKLQRLALPGALAALLAAPAYASQASALAELKAIRAAAAHADLELVRRVEMVRASLPPDASELLKRELATTENRIRGCVPATPADAVSGVAGDAPASPGGAKVGKPALGKPAMGTVPARSPGLDRAQDPNARDNHLPASTSRAQRMRLLATTLAAVLAAAAAGAVFMMYRRAQDKSERLAQLNRELEEHARRDPLTRLQNRRAFLDKMTARTASARRSADGQPDCITLMNIDNFRLVNDRLGHDVGDAVLAEVGRRLKQVVRDTDMLVRWGGEEFLVFSPNAHPNQMRMMLERVMGSVGATPIQVEVHSIAVTISAGLASVPFSDMSEDDFDWQKVVSLADRALHYAKQQGRNRAVAVLGLKDGETEGLAAIEAGFGDAVAQGMVDIMQVHGPAGAQLKQLQPA